MKKNLSIIDARYIYHFVAYNKIHIEFCLIVMNSVCCCYRLFIQPLLLAIILRSNLDIVATLNNYVINLAFFDYYYQEIDEYCFCLLCYHLMKQKKILKFSFLNKVNVIICQNYLHIQETPTLVEKMLIAWYYSVMLIFKL